MDSCSPANPPGLRSSRFGATTRVQGARGSCGRGVGGFVVSGTGEIRGRAKRELDFARPNRSVCAREGSVPGGDGDGFVQDRKDLAAESAQLAPRGIQPLRTDGTREADERGVGG